VVIQHIQARAFERGCADLAAWVKATYPAPDTHAGLRLPTQFHKLAADHSVDAIVFADGRVALMLKTSFWGHDCWSGVVYSSGPILSSEIGTDSYGRKQFLPFARLSDHHIEKQVDDRHFIVAFDLG
jgi:hypothetical protein